MLAACGDDGDNAPSALGGDCVTTTNCVAGLSCEFGSCQQPCASDSECPGAQRCVTGLVVDDAGTAGHVCQLEQDTACEFATECLGKQVCSAAECRDTCTVDTNCTTGQVCANTNVCASRDPAKDNVDGSGNLLR